MSETDVSAKSANNDELRMLYLVNLEAYGSILENAHIADGSRDSETELLDRIEKEAARVEMWDEALEVTAGLFSTKTMEKTPAYGVTCRTLRRISSLLYLVGDKGGVLNCEPKLWNAVNENISESQIARDFFLAVSEEALEVDALLELLEQENDSLESIAESLQMARADIAGIGRMADLKNSIRKAIALPPSKMPLTESSNLDEASSPRIDDIIENEELTEAPAGNSEQVSKGPRRKKRKRPAVPATSPPTGELPPIPHLEPRPSSITIPISQSHSPSNSTVPLGIASDELVDSTLELRALSPPSGAEASPRGHTALPSAPSAKDIPSNPSLVTLGESTQSASDYETLKLPGTLPSLSPVPPTSSISHVGLLYNILSFLNNIDPVSASNTNFSAAVRDYQTSKLLRRIANMPSADILMNLWSPVTFFSPTTRIRRISSRQHERSTSDLRTLDALCEPTVLTRIEAYLADLEHKVATATGIVDHLIYPPTDIKQMDFALFLVVQLFSVHERYAYDHDRYLAAINDGRGMRGILFEERLMRMLSVEIQAWIELFYDTLLHKLRPASEDGELWLYRIIVKDGMETVLTMLESQETPNNLTRIAMPPTLPDITKEAITENYQLKGTQPLPPEYASLNFSAEGQTVVVEDTASPSIFSTKINRDNASTDSTHSAALPTISEDLDPTNPKESLEVKRYLLNFFRSIGKSRWDDFSSGGPQPGRMPVFSDEWKEFSEAWEDVKFLRSRRRRGSRRNSRSRRRSSSKDGRRKSFVRKVRPRSSEHDEMEELIGFFDGLMGTREEDALDTAPEEMIDGIVSKHLVDARLLLERGYKFEASEDFFYIYSNLSKSELDRLVDLTDLRRA